MSVKGNLAHACVWFIPLISGYRTKDNGQLRKRERKKSLVIGCMKS